METIRQKIKISCKTRYQIAKESGVSESQLCKVMQGKTIYCETADILLKYFDMELVSKKTKTQRGK